jgi:hypothetical protein
LLFWPIYFKIYKSLSSMLAPRTLTNRSELKASYKSNECGFISRLAREKREQ